MDAPPLHPDLEPLAFLLGRWTGEGKGEYPTIEPFTYSEEALFAHRGKPFIAYVQRTINLGTNQPAHSESGYLRPAGPGKVELVLSQPTGFVEVHEGTLEGTTISLASTYVGRTSTAKEVSALERVIDVDADALSYRVAMAAVGHPLTHHLAATLHRQA